MSLDKGNSKGKLFWISQNHNFFGVKLADKNRNTRYSEEYRVFYWQRMRDSNPRERSQSPVCYRYTNPLCQRCAPSTGIIIPFFC